MATAVNYRTSRRVFCLLAHRVGDKEASEKPGWIIQAINVNENLIRPGLNFEYMSMRQHSGF